MSLSGKLDVFPLEEVLRLLARAHQNGCLRVEGEGAGRIYMEGGSLTYASVEGDEALRAHLIAAGVMTEESMSRVDISRGSLTEALAPSVSSSALTELIREHCVESLYRIRRPGQGRFEFLVDDAPIYRTGQSFDVETVISEAERRAADWADIETVVPDLTSPWHMVPEIEEDSINLSDTAWRFLAALDGASSVENLSSRLGLTAFQTARRMAEMSRARLVAPAVSAEEAPSTPVIDEPVPATPLATDYGAYTEPEPVTTETAVAERSEPVTQPDRSWWADENTVEDESFLAPDTEVDEDAAVEAQVSHEEDLGEDEDGESFLETVFGELEKTGEDENDEEDSDEGGFGLLRRRGLGAAFRELADS